MKKFLLFIFLISCSLASQNKWTLGVGASAAIFAEEGTNKVKEIVNTQFPSIHVSRKLGKNISADFIYTFQLLVPSNITNSFKYASFDTYLRYDFPEICLKIVPFGGIGFGYVEGATTTPNPQGSFSFNIMGGGTLWVSKRFGLTGRLINKYVSSNSESMASHVQLIGGIVYKFGRNRGFGKGRSHLWDMKF
ncbi:hypothetical protein BTO04_11670 [Polaribacter sp. SA4-10]|uniref:hypothetical protein n=1 Tax=Polaribacter sp. SA4-10 TaxID=754397 RepID=UPI000B3CD56B|nr:hypothetical protein [Polaribacter sp. SA4-10]ARV07305.1 hypothetical protein BTO04_11670 [Polaribacter sp. SA4-10]